jgi:hypothetical protein
MKTFSELISWELEQEKNGYRSLATACEDAAEKLSASVLRKMKYLSTGAGTTPKALPDNYGAA